MSVERVARWALVAIAVIGLAAGGAASFADRPELAKLCWTLATVPVIAGLAISIVRDLLAGRVGVDLIALISMSAAIALGQPLAGAVVALMYAGGNVLEEIAVARAESSLRTLVDRAPRVAHRRIGERVEDTPVEQVEVGDELIVKAGEVVPVDGNVISQSATIDESALTGEPIPVAKAKGARVFSGTLNAGATFEVTASALAGDSAYAGIVKLVTAAQTAKAPVILNALRALSPPHAASRRGLGQAEEQKLQLGHAELLRSLERLRSIADALDDATEDAAAALVAEANSIVQGQIVKHERDDEGEVYPELSKILQDNPGLSAMSRAHREFQHVARLLGRAAADLKTQKIDRYLIHDAQRLVITLETLVRIHSAQEDDIYSAVAAQ